MTVYRDSFYWFCLLFLVSVAGFWPSYFARLGSDGVHVTHHAHGIVMLLWVAMLITQSWLIRTRRNPMHRTLGKASFVLAPLIVITAVWVNNYFARREEPPFPDDFVGTFWFGYFLAFAFAVLYGLAILHRRRVKPHARYMSATALVFLVPGLGRLLGNHLPPLIGWAPTFYQITLVPLAIGLWLLYLDWRNDQPLQPFLVFNGLWIGHLVMWEVAPKMRVWHDLLVWAGGS